MTKRPLEEKSLADEPQMKKQKVDHSKVEQKQDKFNSNPVYATEEDEEYVPSDEENDDNEEKEEDNYVEEWLVANVVFQLYTKGRWRYEFNARGRVQARGEVIIPQIDYTISDANSIISKKLLQTKFHGCDGFSATASNTEAGVCFKVAFETRCTTSDMCYQGLPDNEMTILPVMISSLEKEYKKLPKEEKQKKIVFTFENMNSFSLDQVVCLLLSDIFAKHFSKLTDNASMSRAIYLNGWKKPIIENIEIGVGPKKSVKKSTKKDVSKSK